MLEELQDKRIHVVGVTGAEGAAVALFLSKRIKADFTFHDFCQANDFKKSFWSFHDAYSEAEKENLFTQLTKLRDRINFGDKYLDSIDEADVIYVPQSWFRYKFNEPLRKQQNKFSSITKLYFDLTKAKIIGVTGTSGKSTVTALIANILKRSGQKVFLSGNERHAKQHLEEVETLGKNDYLVLEISNRQLMLDLKASPHVAVISNITPNHLDDHESFEDYINVKKKLFAYQGYNDFLITNYDRAVTKEMKSKGETLFFSQKEEVKSGAFLRDYDLVIRHDEREYQLCRKQELQIKGPHNIENALAAALAAFVVGTNTKEIRDGLVTFKPLDSRLESVGLIDEVEFINDSKSCNPEATSQALATYSKPIILIAGGTRKKTIPGEFDKMAKAIFDNKVKAVILIGETAKSIEETIRKVGKNYDHHDFLVRRQDNLEKAFKDAMALSESGDVVLFSPAAESFGLFKDYRERAQKFRDLVKSEQ